MVEISGSGASDEESISDMRILYPAVPARRVPRYLGKAGTGLRVENILSKCRVSKKGTGDKL